MEQNRIEVEQNKKEQKSDRSIPAMGEAVAFPTFGSSLSSSASSMASSPRLKSSNSTFSTSGLSLLFFMTIFFFKRFGEGKGCPGIKGQSGKGSQNNNNKIPILISYVLQSSEYNSRKSLFFFWCLSLLHGLIWNFSFIKF